MAEVECKLEAKLFQQSMGHHLYHCSRSSPSTHYHTNCLFYYCTLDITTYIVSCLACLVPYVCFLTWQNNHTCGFVTSQLIVFVTVTTIICAFVFNWMNKRQKSVCVIIYTSKLFLNLFLIVISYSTKCMTLVYS